MDSEVANSTRDAIDRIVSSSDYYEILGLQKGAAETDIKKSYRSLARVIHPDKCSLPNCEEAFKKLGAAYKCLSNEESRRTYDLTGAEGQDRRSTGPFDEEIFSQMFAQRGQRQSGVHTNIELPPWLVSTLRIVPWQVVGPVLIVVLLFYFLKLVLWVLSLMIYILPILYLTPARMRWYLVLVVLMLSWLQYL